MAETEPLCWDIEATIEVRITMTKKVRVKSQAEAEHHCNVLSEQARKHYPSGYIGCGVIAVKLADDADKQRERIHCNECERVGNAACLHRNAAVVPPEGVAPR